MYVNHSGWSKLHGAFHYNIFVDENKTDYEIYFADGSVGKQTSPFQIVEADWNNDGDRYEQFGAWFHSEDGRGSFWTPEQMVFVLIEAKEGNRPIGGVAVKDIPDIQVPELDKRPNLEDQIQQSELRAMHQEAERNRKMDMLGIRRPNEPWAR